MDDNYWKHLNSRKTIYTCQFIFSGYYNYAKGYTQNLPQSRFEGK
jgi:hypothetical protein